MCVATVPTSTGKSSLYMCISRPDSVTQRRFHSDPNMEPPRQPDFWFLRANIQVLLLMTLGPDDIYNNTEGGKKGPGAWGRASETGRTLTRRK